MFFQGDVSERYWRTDITETRNDNGTVYTHAEYCSSDYNKTDGH